MREAFIVDYVRSAFTQAVRGALAGIRPDYLAKALAHRRDRQAASSGGNLEPRAELKTPHAVVPC
jgi:hypothetical protein